MTIQEINQSLLSIRSVIPGEEEIKKQVSIGSNTSKLNSEELIQLIQCLDLTSLKSTDTAESISELLSKTIIKQGIIDTAVAAVCVYQPFIAQCKAALNGTNVHVATVAGGFPAGQMDIYVKCADIKHSVDLGADEIDVVINRGYVLEQNWLALFNEVHEAKQACGKAKLKVIMATGEIPTFDLIAKTSWVCMLAGADFIKTSTGLEAVNATLEAGMVMMRMIKRYYETYKKQVGIKPAGGIRTAMEALSWLSLLRSELGDSWVTPKLFRIGASSLLDDLTANLISR